MIVDFDFRKGAASFLKPQLSALPDSLTWIPVWLFRSDDLHTLVVFAHSY